MDNTIGFRRKLLKFGHPIEKPFLRHYLPRHYSTFYPWFKTCMDYPCPDKRRCVPEYKRINVLPPIVVEKPVYEYTKFYPNYMLFIAFVFLMLYGN